MSLSEGESRLVAQLHAQHIEKGFSSKLGVEFLKLFYKVLSETPNCFVICARDDNGHLVGFVSGSKEPKEIKRALLKHPFALLKSLAPCLIKKKLFFGLAELTYQILSRKSENQLKGPELISIVVSKQHRGRGVAEQLFNELTCEFEKLDTREFFIRVGGELQVAQKFYQRMGAKKIARRETKRNKEFFIYKFSLDCSL